MYFEAEALPDWRHKALRLVSEFDCSVITDEVVESLRSWLLGLISRIQHWRTLLHGSSVEEQKQMEMRCNRE